MTKFGGLDCKQEVASCLLGHGCRLPLAPDLSSTDFRFYSCVKRLHIRKNLDRCEKHGG